MTCKSSKNRRNIYSDEEFNYKQAELAVKTCLRRIGIRNSSLGMYINPCMISDKFKTLRLAYNELFADYDLLKDAYDRLKYFFNLGEYVMIAMAVLMIVLAAGICFDYCHKNIYFRRMRATRLGL